MQRFLCGKPWPQVRISVLWRQETIEEHWV
jgi:hypothetical protein